MTVKKKKNYGVHQCYINTNKKGLNVVCVFCGGKKMKKEKGDTRAKPAPPRPASTRESNRAGYAC